MDSLMLGDPSPSARQSILGSFLRGRPRGTSQSHISPTHDAPATRDSPPPVPPPNEHSGHRRRPAANLQPSISQSNSTPGFSQMLRRRRSAGTIAAQQTTPQPSAIAVARTATGPSIVVGPPRTAAASGAPQHRIRLVPHLDSRRSLRFDAISRDVREGDPPLRIGRFTDRSGLGMSAANSQGSNKLAFKSKVVSRAHAEIWCEAPGKFFIKDTKSSSGTFLNHVRLSPANAESRPFEIKDGDMLQLGVDYQGGAEDIYKCVKIKLEVGREWQNHTNPFNANALKQLKSIAVPTGKKSALPDCCICLFCVTINQALFIAPCSHAFHYKCIRPLLETHHPAFSCPLCRTFADLDADVEVEVEHDLDAASIAEVSAAIAAVVSVDARPTTADSSRERERGERDAGAETEVEADGAGHRGRARRARPPLPGGSDMAEDVDAEMEDLVALPPLPASRSQLGVEEIMEDERDASASPSPVPGPARGRRSPGGASSEDGSGDVEGGGSDGSGVGDNAPHAKRKR